MFHLLFQEVSSCFVENIECRFASSQWSTFTFYYISPKGGFQEFALQSRLSTVVESLASSQKCYCLWKHKLLTRISYSVQGSLLTEIFQRYYSRIQEVYRAVNKFKQKRNLLHAVIKTPDLFSISISIAGSGV